MNVISFKIIGNDHYSTFRGKKKWHIERALVHDIYRVRTIKTERIKQLFYLKYTFMFVYIEIYNNF